jgi:GT2 family glycosyltransferase/peptidoglycan/xylan/chitin deacetylase (PgdA/CDA1 family)
MSVPRFSVVICTYQRRDIVTASVEALERQEQGDFEVVVVVDGSTDGTAAALRTLRTSFPLTVIEQPNRGLAAARNAGAAAARGDRLVFLDDDMEADPGLLAAHGRALDAGADVVIGDIPLSPRSPRTLLSEGVGRWASARRERLLAAEEIGLDDLLAGQMAVARVTFEQIGGFDDAFTRGGLFGGEDIDFGYRVQTSGRRVVFAPDAISYQRYDVDPADYLRRSRETGRSAEELIAKHPEREAELGRFIRIRSRPKRALVAAVTALPGPVLRPVEALAVHLVRSGRSGPRVRRLFFGLRGVEHARGARAVRRARARAHVLVLCYHAIADLREDKALRPYGVAPDAFARQLDELRARGHAFVGLDALLAMLDGQPDLPERAVLVTFDDAYADLGSAAAPILHARGIPAVAFAVAGAVGTDNEWDRHLGAGRLELLGWEGLAAVREQGVEIGSHAVAHRILRGLDAEELRREAGDSADRFEAEGLPRPRAFAYPYGEWDETAAGVLRDAGYAVAFTVTPGVVRPGADPHALPRVEVLASDTGWRLWLKLRAAGWPSPARRLGLRLAAWRP